MVRVVGLRGRRLTECSPDGTAFQLAIPDGCVQACAEALVVLKDVERVPEAIVVDLTIDMSA